MAATMVPFSIVSSIQTGPSQQFFNAEEFVRIKLVPCQCKRLRMKPKRAQGSGQGLDEAINEPIAVEAIKLDQSEDILAVLRPHPKHLHYRKVLGTWNGHMKSSLRSLINLPGMLQPVLRKKRIENCGPQIDVNRGSSCAGDGPHHQQPILGQCINVAGWVRLVGAKQLNRCPPYEYDVRFGFQRLVDHP